MFCSNIHRFNKIIFSFVILIYIYIIKIITMKEIKVGSIVRYGSGWYRVTRCTKNIVNLGAVFGNHIYHKSVDKSLVSEDEGSWYANWVQSDTYRSM